MDYKPHEHIPLLLFSLAAAPLAIYSLMQSNSFLSVQFAAYIGMFAGVLAVLGFVAHHRYA